MNTREIGSDAEECAIQYLINKGYVIISRNYRCRQGEVDCIARDGDGTIVFVEVKSRRATSGMRSHPFFQVDYRKQKKLTNLARFYLYEHKVTRTPCRFDVIAVDNGKIEHLKNAFFAVSRR
ncbi:MAG: YraN family protein [Chitinivibrionales bacterium]|nr:YraN family protein [Chitinivibrionales bacterium]